MSNALSSKTLNNNWMGGYEPPSGYFDEFLDDHGKPRPHWDKISQLFGRIDAPSWDRRQRQLERLIHDNGITYNVYGEDSADLRPWNMDMLPLVLSGQDIATIESALSQRAQLLNLILSDVYGRQTLLSSSRLSPYLIFANPSFLRPCHGLLSPRARHIHLYAADLARSPDGSWWVLGDRVEAASGLGYALENRMLMSRVFPRIMWEAETRSLQPFLNAFTSHIEGMAPHNISNPNIALLTAGPNNETYFEQSFLARNLGYTLAEGDDLTVRNNQLYMKTIGGVQRVDVLLRRIDSSWSDPLELRNESLIGVPGLVNAVRQGNVAVANALGSGFVETTAMLAFLPWFCRNYLGEELEMPSVATWWCGQETERKYVIEHLDELVVKPTFWESKARSYFGPRLSTSEKEELIRKIKARPEQYCGQEIVSHATIPIFRDGKLRPRHFQLRVFLTPTDNGWKLMPGGLMRYASQEKDVVVSMQRGGASKDTWALRDGAEIATPSRAPLRSNAVSLRRHHNDLPSRTADNLFWLGRYVERAEGLARVLRALCRSLLDEISPETQLAAIPFIEQIVSPGTQTDSFYDRENKSLRLPVAEATIVRALYDEENLESLVANFSAIERTASKVKERLSGDTWKRLGTMHDLATQSRAEHATAFDDDTLRFLDSTLEALASFVGNLMENTTRSQGWRFMEIGRRIERGLSIVYLLRSVYDRAAPNEDTLISQLLDWADSSITYRRRYLNTLQDANALDVLCFDNTNPRSLSFQTEQLFEILKALPHAQSGQRHIVDQSALQLYSRVGLGNPQLLLKRKRGKPTDFLGFLDATRDDFLRLSQSLEQTYFAHTAPAAERKPQSAL